MVRINSTLPHFCKSNCAVWAHRREDDLTDSFNTEGIEKRFDLTLTSSLLLKLRKKFGFGKDQVNLGLELF